MVVEQAGDLHGQSGAAGDDALFPHEIARGADDAEGIDAVMRVEAPVLEREQHAQIARIDLLGRQCNRRRFLLLVGFRGCGGGQQMGYRLQRRRPELRHGNMQHEMRAKAQDDAKDRGAGGVATDTLQRIGSTRTSRFN